MHSVTRNTPGVTCYVIKLSLGTCAHVSYTVYEGTRTQVFVKIHQQDKSVRTVLLATTVDSSTQLHTETREVPGCTLDLYLVHLYLSRHVESVLFVSCIIYLYRNR